MAKAENFARVLASAATLLEFELVLARSKFAKFLSAETRSRYLRHYRGIVELVQVASQFQICRDPRDDKFLELAFDGKAGAIVTGDEDLLALDPFQGIRILTPQDFLALS